MNLIRGYTTNNEEQFQEIIGKAIDKTQFAEVTTPTTPNTEFSIEHGFGVVPVGFVVIGQDKAAVTFNSTTPWDAENIYLMCNVTETTIRILIF